MTIAEQIEMKMNNYFRKEYEDTKDLLERNPWWMGSKKEVVDKAIQRCLGVAMFVQECGVPYNNLDSYDEYKDRLEELLR